MPLTDTVRHSLLNLALKATAYAGNASVFLSIHTADPGNTGTPGEFTGYTGTRPAITWNNAAAGASTNSAQIDFAGFTSGATITHVGLWTAATAGTFLGGGALSASKAPVTGDTLRFAAAAISTSIQ